MHHISFVLHRQLLRQRLGFTRLALVGEKPKRRSASRVHAKGRSLRISVNASGTTKAILRSMLVALANVMLVISIVVAGALFVPQLYYSLVPADVAPLQTFSQLLGRDPEASNYEEQAFQAPVQERYLPPKSESLPEGDWLVIPRIGVRTELRATEDPEEALTQGVWQAPEYGQPGDQSQPMIVAAHRFGWQWWWQTEYWKYNSFYYLPDTEPGDTVEVISDQRKWVYEIYDGEEGKEIADYDADLILYTCKFLNSPVRHFRYARLVDTSASTQAYRVE